MLRAVASIGGIRLLCAGLIVASSVLLACRGRSEIEAEPDYPLTWLCDDRSGAFHGRRVLGSSDGITRLNPSERIVRLLKAGNADSALALLEIRSDGFRDSKEARYLRAWALTRRAQVSCSLTEALSALAELQQLPGDVRAERLRYELATLLRLGESRILDRPKTVRDSLFELRDRFLAGHVTKPEIAEAVSASPWYVRQIAERELLPRLAARLVGQPTNGEELRELEFLDSLAAELRPWDPMLRQSLDVLLDVWRTQPDRVEMLASALEEFAEGSKAYEDQQFHTAGRALRTAKNALSELSMPMVHWARFYLAIETYYDDATEGLRRFEDLLRLAEQEGYPALAGRTSWLAGSAYLVGNDPDRAHLFQLQAQKYLERAGGLDAAAFSEVLLAEAEAYRGNHTAAWRHRFRAFATVPEHESLRRQIAMYWEAATALDREGRADLSGPLHRRALRLSHAWGRPLGMSTSLHSHAMWQLEHGRGDEALEELRNAAGWIARMEAGSLKAERERSQEGYYGVAISRADPRKGVESLDRAFRRHRDAGRTLEALELLPHRAAALQAMGKPADAEEALRAGLRLFDDAYAAAESSVTRSELLFEARSFGGILVELLFERGALAESLAVAERIKRHRYVSLRSMPAEESHLELLRRGSSVWLSTFATDESTFWWLSKGPRVQSALRLPRQTVQSSLKRFRSLAQTGGSQDEIERSLEHLFELVAGPLHLSRVARVLYLPDQESLLVPLAALRDSATSRYLIETSEIFLASGHPRRSLYEAPTEGGAGLLLAAVEGGDVSRRLPNLPGVRNEAALLERSHPERVTVLVGRSVGREELLRRLEEGPAIFHFAGHAVQNSLLPQESFLSLGASGELIRMRELRDLDLAGVGLAVLSSCTSLDAFGDRRDASFGLAGALVAAGVDSVLASSGPIRDDATVRFLESFYQEFGSGVEVRTAKAYQAAVVRLLAAGGPAASPGSWAFWNVLEPFRIETDPPDPAGIEPTASVPKGKQSPDD